MKPIYTECDKELRVSRAEYDLLRRGNSSYDAICQAPFVNLDLRASGLVAPCRYATIGVGNAAELDLQSIWDGEVLGNLRRQFCNYRIKCEECFECTDLWLAGIAEESPALSEFDGLPCSTHPKSPLMLNLDLRAPISSASLETIFRWLTALKRLSITISRSQQNKCFTAIMDQVAQLPIESRPEILVRFCDAIPETADMPEGISIVELAMDMTSDRLPADQEEALEDLARGLQAYCVPLVLAVRVNRKNWIHLRAWLQRAKRLGASLDFRLIPALEDESLAGLDGDALSCLHQIYQCWLDEYPPHPDSKLATRLADNLLARLGHWQAEAAGRRHVQNGLAFPSIDHSLVQDENAFERFLGTLLRIYDDPRVEQWLEKIVQSEGLPGKTHRRTFRLAAFWLICVFDRNEILPLLRRLLGSTDEARELIRKDRKAIAGTAWQNWFDAWTEQLNLKSLQPRSQSFEVPVPRAVTAGKKASVTVIIPSYNHEAYIGEAIRSVLSQTRTDFNILVVDDASQDKTVEEAKKFQDPRIRVTRNPTNLGLGMSLARALEEIETEFAAILNSDDVYSMRRLEACLSVLESDSKWGIVSTGLSPMDNKGRICSASSSSPLFEGLQMHNWLRWYEGRLSTGALPANVFEALLERNFLLTTSNIVARTGFIREQREAFQDLEFCLDWYLFLTAALQEKLCYLPDILLGYRLHEHNTVWFDSDRSWRYYLESNQVVARILEALFQRGEELPTGAISTVLNALTNPLAVNSTIDWPGVILGFLFERLSLFPRGLEGRNELVEKIRILEKARNARQKADNWAQEFAGQKEKLYHMRGEYPFLRSMRNSYEALKGKYSRLCGESAALLFDRANTERWWHKAEEERDFEIGQRLQLQQKIERLQAEMDALQATRLELQQEIEHLQSEMDALQATRLELQQEIERLKSEMDALQASLKKDLVNRELELEDSRQLVQTLRDERDLLKKSVESMRSEQDDLLSKMKMLEAERSALHDEVKKLTSEQYTLQNHIDVLTIERDEQQRRAELRTAERDALRDQIRILTAERDDLRNSQEYRLGSRMLDRLHLRTPVNVAARLWAKGHHAFSYLRLAAERAFGEACGNRLRALATVCSTFPIYSQTFVYQELTQLATSGFDLRLTYSDLDSKDRLHPQFGFLWKAKRRLVLNRKLHERHFAHYLARMPKKVESLIDKLSKASGLSREELIHHDNFLQAFSFTRIVESYRPHYLHSYFFYDRSLMTLIASFLLEIPRGISCYADHLLKDYELKVVPLHMELCDIVIATSERIKRELLEIAPSVNPGRILVKPNAVDTERFPMTERHEPSGDEPYRLACVCRIEPKKGLLYLVEAVHMLRREGLRVELHLVGEADAGVQASEEYKCKLDQKISELDLWGTVHLEGRHNEEGVLRFLHISHLFVAPFVETETGDKDGIPTALLEAMATGLPAVATDAGSIPEVIDDGQDGILVPQRNPEALARAIEAMLHDPDRRLRMGRRAEEKVRNHFDVRVCEKSFHERVQVLVGNRRSLILNASEGDEIPAVVNRDSV